MSSPKRNLMQPSAGKLLDTNDHVFDLTEFYKGLSTGSYVTRTPKNAQVAIGTGPTPLSNVSLKVKSVSIQAAFGNAGYVYIGDVDVDTNNGYEMVQGGTLTFEEVDLADIYIDGANPTDKVGFFAVV